MTVAADLLQAANLAPQNLRVLWEADTLKTRMIAFWTQINPAFTEQQTNDRPVSNWISIIAAMAPAILVFADKSAPGFTPYAGGTIATFELAVDHIYRICKFGFYYTLISAGQKTALLTAYNTQFG